MSALNVSVEAPTSSPSLAGPPGSPLAQPPMTLAQIVEQCSLDPIFFAQFFFPRAIRQSVPQFHKVMWDDLLSPARYVAFEIFRGGAKTTTCRVAGGYFVSFGMSHTILWVGKSETAAIASVTWLMHQVEINRPWAAAFKLQKGKKWTEGDIEIFHGTDLIPIRILAYGMTGSIRGVNIEDYRPDLIIVDDPCDEENTGTEEQRRKTDELFFGALQNSLAPASEAPLAKMVLMQTVLNPQDLISKCVKDPAWTTRVFGCFDEAGQSRWPERLPTDTLLAEKQSYISRNQLSLWMREMECKIVSAETASFPSHWMKLWEVLPLSGKRWIAIDPTPPPKETADGLPRPRQGDLDTAVIMVLQRIPSGAVYVCETYGTKSPDSEEFIVKMFELAIKWKVKRVKIETVLFARMFKSLIDKAMLRLRHWLIVVMVEDKRKKSTRIIQEVGPLASAGQLFFHASQADLISQFQQYPSVAHDDYLDTLAIGLSDERAVGIEDDVLEGEFEEVPEPQEWARAP